MSVYVTGMGIVALWSTRTAQYYIHWKRKNHNMNKQRAICRAYRQTDMEMESERNKKMNQIRIVCESRKSAIRALKAVKYQWFVCLVCPMRSFLLCPNLKWQKTKRNLKNKSPMQITHTLQCVMSSINFIMIFILHAVSACM